MGSFGKAVERLISHVSHSRLLHEVETMFDTTLSNGETADTPLVDHVVLRTLEALSQHPEFDQKTIERVREMVRVGSLNSYDAVVKALTTEAED